MSKFSMAFKKARINSGRTFRDMAKEVGKSIGYLSDIDSGRKHPPERLLVLKLERFLGVTDGHLVRLADEHRINVPNNLKHIVSEKPQLGEFLLMSQTLLREDDSFSSQLDTFLEEMRKRMRNNGIEPHEVEDLFHSIFDRDQLKNAGLVGVYEQTDYVG